MVPEKLLVLMNVVGGLLLEPVRVALVELCAELLRRGLVRRVADEYVGEAEAVVAGEVGAIGTNELLAHEREQARADLGPLGAGQKLCDCTSVKASAFDRGPLDHRAVGRLEPVDSGREERPERRRHERLGVRSAVFGLHGEKLLDEERVAVGRLQDFGAGRTRECAVVEERVHECVHLRLDERLQREERRIVPERRPGWSRLQQLGPPTAEQQDRPLAAEAGHVLDEIEEPGLGPMEVLEDDDQRPVAGQRLEQRADRPVGLVRRPSALRSADGGRDRIGNEFCVLVRAEELYETVPRLAAGNLPNDLDERPVGDALAIG